MSKELMEQLAGKIVCYHGTSQENAESILREGFREGSYFAYRIEDSLKFGGLHLFAVAFSAEPSMWHGEPNGFQFHLRQAQGPEEILWHTPIVQELITAHTKDLITPEEAEAQRWFLDGLGIGLFIGTILGLLFGLYYAGGR